MQTAISFSQTPQGPYDHPYHQHGSFSSPSPRGLGLHPPSHQPLQKQFQSFRDINFERTISLMEDREREKRVQEWKKTPINMDLWSTAKSARGGGNEAGPEGEGGGEKVLEHWPEIASIRLLKTPIAAGGGRRESWYTTTTSEGGEDERGEGGPHYNHHHEQQRGEGGTGVVLDGEEEKGGGGGRRGREFLVEGEETAGGGKRRASVAPFPSSAKHYRATEKRDQSLFGAMDDRLIRAAQRGAMVVMRQTEEEVEEQEVVEIVEEEEEEEEGEEGEVIEVEARGEEEEGSEG